MTDYKDNNLTYVEEDDKKYDCSLAQAFDQYILCYTIGGQATNYYRYGERKNCKTSWENLKFCLQLKSKPIEIRKKIILEREALKAEQKSKEKNSLDVWEIRE
ncbi:15137_t:CDS:2 [Funneliformis caledonium]|uniref:15137_t:CDS:1 n=2 Tax=Funneliformis TaxID=1117308 RepID=A0A9N9I9X1_9GLOM|nr:9672_t:CDS:2 [Funneliformis mosseae]CAG8726203.1 15137_t:CDS:2 [Funneliformis caledonium]